MNKCTINDIALNIGSGLTPLRSNIEFWNSTDYQWLKTEQLGSFQIYDTGEYISKTALEKTTIKLWPPKTISVAMYGEGKTRGNVSIIMKEMTTNQACCNIIVNPIVADYRYIYYWLKSNYEQLRVLSSGVRKNLNSDDIKTFPVKLPELSTQSRMADVLFVVDRKIEHNNRFAAELEEMAKTIFDYWFVQFDFPNSEGKPYRSSGGVMVWNDQLKREIPKDWKIKNLEEFIKVIRGVTYSKDDVSDVPKDGYTMLLRANNISNGTINYDNLVYVKDNCISDNQMLSVRSIFIAMSSGSKEHVGKTAIVPCSLNSAFGAFCSKIEIVENAFAWLMIYFRTEYFKTYINNICLGTNINNITNEHIGSIKIAVPPKSVLDKYSNLINPLISKQGNIHIESQELIKLRDWLLPMLMSGQVKFKSINNLKENYLDTKQVAETQSKYREDYQ